MDSSLTEQYIEDGRVVNDIHAANSVRLWDYDMCVVEFTRHRNGWWVVTGSDVRAFDVKALKGYRDPASALDAACQWWIDSLKN